MGKNIVKSFSDMPLGRRLPANFDHVKENRYGAVAAFTVAKVERSLALPDYRTYYNQGREGACVGFSSSWMMSILNKKFYDAHWLWNEAKLVDGDPSTNPGDDNGTTVHAGMQVLQSKGHVVRDPKTNVDSAPILAEGIQSAAWATTVDEIRAAIAAGTPVTLGINWYENFDTPVKKKTSPVTSEYWIGKGALGQVRGGHAICAYAASDKRRAVGLVNSWGMDYPLVWVPYTVISRLLREDGEAACVVDR